MHNSKVSIWIWLGAGFLEVFTFTQQVLMELASKGQISSLGEERFLLKNGQKTHGLLKHGDTFLQIHAKVNIGPLNTFPDVFFLLEAIVVKDLEASNIQATNVLDLLHREVNQGLV